MWWAVEVEFSLGWQLAYPEGFGSHRCTTKVGGLGMVDEPRAKNVGEDVAHEQKRM